MPNSYVYPVKSLLQGIQPAGTFNSITVHQFKSSGDSNEAEQDDTTTPDVPSSDSRRNKSPRNSVTTPNFRHYPANDSASPPQSFTSNRSHLSSTAASPTLNYSDPFTATSLPSLSSEYDPRHPPPFPVVLQDVFSSATSPREEMDEDLPWNPSELGIVHLDSSSNSSSSSQSKASTNVGSSSRGRSLSPYETADENLSSGEGSNAPDSNSTAASDSAWMSVKFQHVRDENGNHVVLGREGDLTRCEDEVRLLTHQCIESHPLLAYSNSRCSARLRCTYCCAGEGRNSGRATSLRSKQWP